MASSYDQVLYPNRAFPDTHPDRMAAIARLLGLNPKVGKCRVLEVGCGDGSNLIPMAISLPEADLVGVDLAEKPIESGRALVQSLNLAHVDLRALDLLDFPSDSGEFDYIIAHGFCSWVPVNVLEKFFAICRDHLAQNGIVYASYNTYPQGHLRKAIRDAMKFRMNREQGTVAAAKDYIRTLEHATPDEFWKSILKHESDRLSGRDDNALYHDDLNVYYRCFYFSELAQIASQHGLEFLSEAKLKDAIRPNAPAGAIESARRLAAGDETAFQQHLDFTMFQGFRRTLFCRSGSPIDRTGLASRLPALRLASHLRLRGFDGKGVATFTADRGTERLQTDDPLLIGILKQLEGSWPNAVSYSDLVASDTPIDRRAKLDANLAGLVGASLLELRAFDLKVASSSGVRPVASPLARVQAIQGPLLTSLLHTHVEVADPTARHFLASLDGSKTRTELKDLMVTQNGHVPADIASGFIEEALSGLYRMGLMVG